MTERSEELQVTLKIENYADGRKTIICLSGRLQSNDLDELKAQLAGGAQSQIVLDLNGVTLVDVEGVRFLNGCEERGVELLHRRPYIQEWMIREKSRDR
jgi:anti-anti-sigma regulatory factor